MRCVLPRRREGEYVKRERGEEGVKKRERGGVTEKREREREREEHSHCNVT